MEILDFLYSRLYDFNKAWAPHVDTGMEEIYLLIISLAEILILFLIFYKMLAFLFRVLVGSASSKPDSVTYTGGFRRRFDRIAADASVEYRFDKEGEYAEGVCKDISLHGMKLEVNEDMPEIHQRLEIVLDGKKLKLKNKDRVKLGGFVVRVVEKKSRLYDLGIEFYHLFRNQIEMIQALIEKKKK